MNTQSRSHPYESGGVPGANAPGTQEKAQDVAGQAQEKASELAGQAQDRAQDLAGQARSQARTQIEQRSIQAAEQINQQAADLRTVSSTLREQGKDGPAQAADRLAGLAEKVGGYLRDSDADKLLHDAEDLGRRKPWVAAGGGLLLGLTASRFLKASSRERFSARSRGGYARPQISSPAQLGATVPPPNGSSTSGAELGGGRGPVGAPAPGPAASDRSLGV